MHHDNGRDSYNLESTSAQTQPKTCIAVRSTIAARIKETVSRSGLVASVMLCCAWPEIKLLGEHAG